MNNISTIFIGGDHRGFETKQQIKNYLVKKGFDVVDKGNFVYNPDDDYPDFAFKVATEVANNKNSRGILICGSSIGISIAANKQKTIRASNPRTSDEAKEDREHHDSNILALSSNRMKVETMKQIIDIWLNTEFEGGRHQRRIQKILDFEAQCSCPGT